MALPAYSGPRPITQFRNNFPQTVGLLGRVMSLSQGRYLNTGQHKRRINAYTHQSSMAWVGLEPTISASEWAKTVHALDRAVTVTDFDFFLLYVYHIKRIKLLWNTLHIENFDVCDLHLVQLEWLNQESEINCVLTPVADVRNKLINSIEQSSFWKAVVA
jgi:hypothetical protein